MKRVNVNKQHGNRETRKNSNMGNVQHEENMKSKRNSEI